MGGRCCVCELRKKKYLCPTCFHKAAASRRHDVAALSRERDAQLERLNEALALKEQELEQARTVQLLVASEVLRESQTRVADLEDRLAAIRRRAAELRQQTLERQARLREARQQLGRWVQQAARERSGQLEMLGRNYLRSLDLLSREQRTRVVRRLLDILPVKLMAPGGAGQGNVSQSRGGTSAGEERAVVMVCGLLLPDSRDNIGELVQLLPQLGSSLGYVALLLDVMSRFLQLPLLHRACFQGSTSRLWQPDSFWDMRAAPPADALPLFINKHPDGGSSGGGGGWGEAAGGAGAAIYSAVAGMTGMADGPGGSAVSEAAQAAAQQNLQRALYCLQRSAGALVHARLGPDAPLKVPPDWSPLAWLGGLCKMLAAEPRPPLSASRIVAAPHAHGRGAGPGGLAASAVFGRLSPQQDALGQSMMWPDEECGDEEWDIIPRPSYGRMIPPPPSQPDDVEHWAQAMFPGAAAAAAAAQAQQQGQALQQGQGRVQQLGAQAALGSSPVDRLLRPLGTLGSLTRNYLGGGLPGS